MRSPRECLSYSYLVPRNRDTGICGISGRVTQGPIEVGKY